MTSPREKHDCSYYIDSHCHFDFAPFDEDRAELWHQCAQRDIRQLLIPGVAPAQWPQAEKICKEFDGVFFAAGLHPWWVSDYLEGFASKDQALNSLFEKQSAWLKKKYCVAVGECGMDISIDTPLAIQKMFFIEQLGLAKSSTLPLIVHSLKTHNEILKIIKDENFDGAGVIHAFSGSRQIAEDFIDEGFFIGVGGTITYERAKKTREAVANIPLDRIVLETDAPDMPLNGQQGKRNSPVYLPKIAKVLAVLRGDDVSNILRQTGENAVRLFALDTQRYNQSDKNL